MYVLQLMLFQGICFAISLALLHIHIPELDIYENTPYYNRLKILPPKNENFQIKNSDIFHISAQNTDCGYLLELPQ